MSFLFKRIKPAIRQEFVNSPMVRVALLLLSFKVNVDKITVTAPKKDIF